MVARSSKTGRTADLLSTRCAPFDRSKRSGTIGTLLPSIFGREGGRSGGVSTDHRHVDDRWFSLKNVSRQTPVAFRSRFSYRLVNAASHKKVPLAKQTKSKSEGGDPGHISFSFVFSPSSSRSSELMKRSTGEETERGKQQVSPQWPIRSEPRRRLS